MPSARPLTHRILPISVASTCVRGWLQRRSYFIENLKHSRCELFVNLFLIGVLRRPLGGPSRTPINTGRAQTTRQEQGLPSSFSGSRGP